VTKSRISRFRPIRRLRSSLSPNFPLENQNGSRKQDGQTLNLGNAEDGPDGCRTMPKRLGAGR
jgi:hypothetical protein